jgi:hypothetical protein
MYGTIGILKMESGKGLQPLVRQIEVYVLKDYHKKQKALIKIIREYEIWARIKKVETIPFCVCCFKRVRPESKCLSCTKYVCASCAQFQCRICNRVCVCSHQCNERCLYNPYYVSCCVCRSVLCNTCFRERRYKCQFSHSK